MAAMPLLSIVIVVSLGAGIGVNTVVFSWIQAVVLQPLPGVARSGSFHLIEPRSETGSSPGSSWLELLDLQASLHSFRDVIASRMVALYVGEPGRVERTYGQLVSGNYFSGLAVKPALGRFPRPDEVSRPGGEPIVVISYDFWQDRFGGAPDVVSKTLRVNGAELSIVGVAPRRFQGTILGLNFDLWVPATLAPIVLNGSRELEDRSVRGYSLMGLLQPGVTREQAQSEVESAMRELARAYPASNRNMTADVLAFSDAPRGPQRFLMTALALLQGIMLLLLLAVCGNTANLVLARASVRQREVGVRLALGASRWQIGGLLLAENLLLGLLGAAFGVAIAVWGTQALPSFRISGLPIRFQTGIDAFGLAFGIALGLGCGLLFGAVPAVQLSRIDPLAALRSGSRTAGRSRVRNALMGIQVALALMVLVVAGLFFQRFMETRDTDPGFRRDGVLLAAYDLNGRAAPSSADARARQFATTLLARVRSVPAIESAAIASSVPLDIHGLPIRVFTLEGHARSDDGFDEALTNTVTAGYFDTMRIAVRAGTDFAPLTHTAAPPQAIVNEAFVKLFLQSEEPAIALGRWITARGGKYTIVGVVRNSLYNAFGEPPTPIIYFSYRDRPTLAGELHLRARTGAETSVAPDVRRIARELDPDLPLYNVRTLSEHIENNLLFRRIPARMFVVLGPLLLILAAVGIYAVVAYTVSQRTMEIGVRLALGATNRRVIAQAMGQSLLAAGLGALAGWLITFVVVVDFVPNGTVDVPVFAGVPALLLTVAAVACWLPARRATRVDPVVVLRRD
jgi:predicted permease